MIVSVCDNCLCSLYWILSGKYMNYTSICNSFEIYYLIFNNYDMQSNGSRLFPKVWEYIEDNGLTPALPRVYNRLWYSKQMTRYHLTVLLLRDLSFDPHLNPLTPESFQKKTDRISLGMTQRLTFLRHHIRANDKLNNDPNYLELTTFKEHGDLEVYKSFIGSDLAIKQ